MLLVLHGYIGCPIIRTVVQQLWGFQALNSFQTLQSGLLDALPRHYPSWYLREKIRLQ